MGLEQEVRTNKRVVYKIVESMSAIGGFRTTMMLLCTVIYAFLTSPFNSIKLAHAYSLITQTSNA